MCLDAGYVVLSEKEISKERTVYKIVKRIMSDYPKEWYSDDTFQPAIFNCVDSKERYVIGKWYRSSILGLDGFHAYVNKNDALSEYFYHKNSCYFHCCVVKVIFKNTTVIGYQDGLKAIVANNMIIDKIISTGSTWDYIKFRLNKFCKWIKSIY